MTNLFKQRFEPSLLTYQALALMERLGDDVFFVLGGVNPWVEETLPPELDEVPGIPDPFLWVRVQQVRLALNDTLGDLSSAYRITQDLKGGQWTVFPPETYSTFPYPNEASHLYLTADLTPEMTSIDTFRAVGLVAHPELVSGISPTLMQYEASNISQEGLILWRTFHSPITIDQTIRLEVIL